MNPSKDRTLVHSGYAPTIALVADDCKRDELVDLLREFTPWIDGWNLVATYVTGAVCSQRLDVEIRQVESSFKGGDLQIGALVAEGKLDAVICIRDPLSGPPYSFDVMPLPRVCDINKVPVATNTASARAILRQLLFGCSDESTPPIAPDLASLPQDVLN